MHAEVRQWIDETAQLYPDKFAGVRVLDVGSRDVNGNTRQHFKRCQYIGVDVIEGPNVDIVMPVHKYLESTDMRYNTIICTETLEHDKYVHLSILSMIELLKPGGLLIITAAGPNRGEHGTASNTPEDSPGTLDYYKNVDMSTLITPGKFSDIRVKYARNKQDIYFTGLKEL